MIQTVLVAEGDSAVRGSRARLLSGAGFPVIEAGTAAEALRLACEHSPALVLLDPQLPGLDDAAAFAARLETHPETRSTAVVELADSEHAAGRRLGRAERCRPLYDANIIGIVTADSERILDANDVFLAMVGHSREDLEAGRIRWREMTPAEHRAADARALEEIEAAGRATPYEKEYFRRDGSRVPVLIGVARLEQEPLRYVCFVLDLTERRRLQLQLLAKQKMEGIGGLAAGIAHEFNNLLTGILGNASLALSGKRNRGTPYVEAIVAAGERGAHLTHELLAYAGKGQFHIEEVSLGEVVAQSRELLRLSVPRSVELRFEQAGALPEVRADRRQLQQMMMNLVANAAEAIEPGLGRIVVRTGVETFTAPRATPFGGEVPAGRYVLLEVADTGSGMTEDAKGRLFEPFFTTKSTGRGLGLPAVAGIVRSCGGTIEVESSPGGGAKFRIFFPALGPAAGGEEPAPAGERAGAAAILVVDDEAYVRDFMTAALGKRRYRVLTAGDGRRALDLLERHPEVRLVLVDLVMPIMAGDEFVRAARAARPSLKVLLTSGWSRDEVRKLCMSARGDIDFIQKPYSAERLVGKIEAMLRPRGGEGGVAQAEERPRA